MQWIITIAIIVLSAGLTAFAGWKTGRPPRDSARTQWVSWQWIMFTAAIVTVFAVVHAMNLMGYHTGARTVGAYGG
jgi:Na+-driven multidrug efflux pump